MIINVETTNLEAAIQDLNKCMVASVQNVGEQCNFFCVLSKCMWDHFSGAFFFSYRFQGMQALSKPGVLLFLSAFYLSCLYAFPESLYPLLKTVIREKQRTCS